MSENPPDVKTIFGRALEIPSDSERAAYLNEACAGNPALRSDVDGLLAAIAKTGSFLNKPAADPNVFAPTVLANTLTEGPGTTIGPYKLLQQIGEGGFGVVYMAEQETPVRRTVALKIIKPGMDTREVIARFEAERQALAMMDHHNIARVFDAGATATGRPYFVMELVKGIPITEYCNNNKLTPRERIELFVAVCQAIQHAHQKGIIHRDVKPSNVLVCLYDGKPVPKVIDFGVAKAIEQRLTEKTMFTRHGQVVGTLEYMSPEQAELSQLDIDTRSDIYSLGVLLYELLTGTTPLTKDQLRQAGFTEMLRMIRETEPERPSTRLSRSHATLASISAQRRTEPAKLGALLRGELDWIVMRALEKDRTRRYETANSLARDIERYLNDEPVEACPPSVGYRLRKIVRRNRRSVAVGTTIFALLLALLINFFVSYFRLKEARAQIADEAARAQQAEALALDRLAESDRLRERAEAAEKEAVVAKQQALRQLKLTETAEREAVEQKELEAAARDKTMDALARSQLEQARAVRLADQPGRRWVGLDLLKRTEAIRSRKASGDPNPAVTDDSPESPPILPSQSDLRTEALAALLTGDGRVARQFPGFSHAVSPDRKFAVSFIVNRDFQAGSLAITELSTGKTLREWKGKDAETVSGIMMALSPGAEQLAALALNMRDIKVWQLRDLKLLQTLTMPKPLAEANAANAPDKPAQPSQPIPLRLVRQLTFSFDGQYLSGLTTRENSETALLLWKLDEPDSGQMLASVRGMAVMTSAFSPDGRRIAFPTGGRNVTVWDIAEKRAVSEIELPLTTYGAIGFHPNGNLLAIHCQDTESKSRLLLWDIAQNREAARIETPFLASTVPISFTSDGHRAAIVGANGVLVVCDVPPSPRFGERPPLRMDHGSMPQTLEWSSDGILFTGSLAGLKQWELAGGDALTLQRLESSESPGMFGRLSFSPDANVVAAMPWHGAEVITFDRLSGKKLRSWRDRLNFDAAADVRFSPDGKWLVRSGLNGVVAWDSRSGEEKMQLPPDTVGLSAATSIGFPPGGNLLAAGMHGGKPAVRDVGTGKTVWPPSGTESPPLMAAVSPNGRFVLNYRAFALAGETPIPVWDLEANRLRFTIPGPSDKSTQSLVEISPDSRWILALHYGGDISKSFPRGTPETRHVGEALTPATTFVPPSPVRFIFGSSAANALSTDQTWAGDVWNAQTGKSHLSLSGSSTVEYYAFSRDGRYLAISMRNQTIRVWDVNAARELFDWRPTVGLNRTPFSPRHLAFTADSLSLVVPDPSAPVLHLLDLNKLNSELRDISLQWEK